MVGQCDRPNARITAIVLVMSNGEGPIPDSLRAAYALVMIREEPEANNICARL